MPNFPALRSCPLRSTLLALGSAWSICVLSAPAEQFLGEGTANLSADAIESDLRNGSHVLRGNVRISQGVMLVEADSATASALELDRSRWTFSKDVHIQTAQADLKSNSAAASFNDGQISHARFTGSPAVFEQRGGAPAKQVRGRAGVIEYDSRTGMVTFSDDVWFSYDGNEIRGNTVVYNVQTERVIANPDGPSKGRVNIKIRPRNGGAQSQPSATAAPSTPGNDGNGA